MARGRGDRGLDGLEQRLDARAARSFLGSAPDEFDRLLHGRSRFRRVSRLTSPLASGLHETEDFIFKA
jgi:hypothetical protein